MNADECNENGGTIDDVVTASFQADLVIAKMVQNGVCDMVVANDSDILFLHGKNIMQIAAFKLQKERGRNKSRIELMILKDISIRFSYKETYEIIRRLKINGPNMKVIKAKYPLIEALGDCNSALLRALIAVSLGCDTIIGGIKGIGPSNVLKFLTEYKVNVNGSITDNTLELCGQFSDWMVSKGKIKGQDTEFYNTLALAFIGEPCMDIDDFRLGKYQYLDDVSFETDSISEYLQDFVPKNESITIIKNPKTRICNSYSYDANHMYLECETGNIHQCQICGNKMCYHCIIQDSENDNGLCFC